MQQGEKGTKTDEMLPQDDEGDVFPDKGNSDSGDQSDQVGGKDGRYSAVVVAVLDKLLNSLSKFLLLPEPTKEEHSRYGPNKEDGLRKRYLHMLLFLHSTCEKAGIQESSQTQSRSLTADLFG